MAHRRRLTAALAVAAVAATAACGTTVDQAYQGTGPAATGDGLTAPLAPGQRGDGFGGIDAPGSAEAGTATGSTGEGAAGSTEGAGGSMAIGGGSSGERSGRTPAASTGATAEQPSVAASAPLKIGFVLPAGSPGNLVGSSFGYDADTSTQLAQAFVDELNATGGVAGRKVQPAYAYVDSSDQSDGTQTDRQNAACVSLTEDAKVFAAISLQPTALNFAYDCFARHRTPLIDANLNGTDEQRIEELYPWLMTPAYMSFSRMARLLPRALHEQGFLTKKMALISYDRPDLRRSAQQVLVPAIEALGGDVVDEYYLEGTYQGLSSGTANAALKFRSMGVDRVVMWAPGGGALVLFARQAESQGYRPRYAVSTYDAPALAASLLGSVAPDQLAGAAGVGFLPATDLDDAQSGPLNPREKKCFDVARTRTGRDYQSRRQSGAGLALGVCETTRFLQAALSVRAGRTLVPADLAVEVAALGTSYQAAVVERTSFHRHKLDGAALGKHLYYDRECPCFRYRGNWRPVPDERSGGR